MRTLLSKATIKVQTGQELLVSIALQVLFVLQRMWSLNTAGCVSQVVLWSRWYFAPFPSTPPFKIVISPSRNEQSTMRWLATMFNSPDSSSRTIYDFGDKVVTRQLPVCIHHGIQTLRGTTRYLFLNLTSSNTYLLITFLFGDICE